MAIELAHGETLHPRQGPLSLLLPEASWTASKTATARIRKMVVWSAQKDLRERLSFAIKLTAAIAICLVLAECSASAEGGTAAQVAARVREQIQRLGDKDPKVQVSAADELGRIGRGAEKAIPALGAALNGDTGPEDGDDDIEVGFHAALALGQIGPKSLPVLSDALAYGHNGKVRFWAEIALPFLGAEAVPSLTAALEKDNDDLAVRRTAAEELGKIGPDARKAISALSVALTKNTEDLTLRGYAAQSLGLIGLEAVPALSEAVARDKGNDEFTRALAAETLGAIGPGAKKACPALIAALTDTVAKVRANAAEALGKIGPGAKGAIPALSDALAKDPDESTRNMAAGSLVQIAEAARDSQRTDMIEQLALCAQALEASSFHTEAARVRTAVDLLKAMRQPLYAVLHEIAGRHIGLTALVAVYIYLSLFWLALLWRPRWPFGESTKSSNIFQRSNCRGGLVVWRFRLPVCSWSVSSTITRGC